MKDSQLHWLVNDWEKAYTKSYNKMLDDWDQARAQCKANAQTVQQKQIIESKIINQQQLQQQKSEERILLLKDQQSKLEGDLTSKKKKLEQQIQIAQDLERQMNNKNNDELFLNHKEFGINKQILNEMTNDDIHEDTQVKVI